MIQNLRIYLRLLRIQIRSQAMFKTSLFMDIISTAFFGLTEIFGFLLVVGRLGDVAGWSIWEIAFLGATVEFSFGCMDMIFSGFDPDYFAPSVRRGDLDILLLRPISLTIQVMGSRFVLRRLGRILTGVFVIIIAISHLTILWTFPKIAYYLVIIISQIALLGSFFIIGSTITFWSIERIEAVNIITYGGREVMTYPMEVFPRWLRQVFIFFLPFLFMNYSPALFILSKLDPFTLPLFCPFLSPMIGALFLLAALVFWRFGRNYYQSTGN